MGPERGVFGREEPAAGLLRCSTRGVDGRDGPASSKAN